MTAPVPCPRCTSMAALLDEALNTYGKTGDFGLDDNKFVARVKAAIARVAELEIEVALSTAFARVDELEIEDRAARILPGYVRHEEIKARLEYFEAGRDEGTRFSDANGSELTAERERAHMLAKVLRELPGAIRAIVPTADINTVKCMNEHGLALALQDACLGAIEQVALTVTGIARAALAKAEGR